jgi:hypothetical protein
VSNALITQLTRETLLTDSSTGNVRATQLTRETLLNEIGTCNARVTHLSRETLLQLRIPLRILALGMNTPTKMWYG